MVQGQAATCNKARVQTSTRPRRQTLEGPAACQEKKREGLRSTRSQLPSTTSFLVFHHRHRSGWWTTWRRSMGSQGWRTKRTGIPITKISQRSQKPSSNSSCSNNSMLIVKSKRRITYSRSSLQIPIPKNTLITALPKVSWTSASKSKSNSSTNNNSSHLKIKETKPMATTPTKSETNYLQRKTQTNH